MTILPLTKGHVTGTLPRLIEDQVADAVDAELRQMVCGDSFKKLVATVVDGMVKETLCGLSAAGADGVPGIETGPSAKCKKVKVSLPSDLYDRVKALGGPSSSHVTLGLRLYIQGRALKEESGDGA